MNLNGKKGLGEDSSRPHINEKFYLLVLIDLSPGVSTSPTDEQVVVSPEVCQEVVGLLPLVCQGCRHCCTLLPLHVTLVTKHLRVLI